MALRGSPRRKDVKKSSYYVWFLGAKESRGLRGEEYVRPVVRHLLQKERDVEPFKVTLQVSNKGLKIIQNVPGKGAVTGKGGSSGAAGGKAGSGGGGSSGDIVKHFIPHHAVTCAVQDSPPNEDVVSAILLIYNPVTRCPVHVHSYRCDSVETATILRSQLQTLIERPENQRKFSEIESRLHAKGLLVPPGSPQRVGSPGEPPITIGSPTGGLHHHQSNGRGGGRTHGGGSDGRSSSTRESESSGSSERGNGHPASPPGGGNADRITSLYDSLAAELREKLGEVGSGGGGKKRHGPILLPPRDYDTVHRKHGNLTGIDLRRCLNANIVGVNARSTAAPLGSSAAVAATPSGKKGVGPGSGSAHGAGYTLQQGGSSGGSSGIGSDDAPSPENDRESSDPRYLDNQSSSDEEWNERSGQPSAMSEDSMFLVQPTWQPKQTQQPPRQQPQQRPLNRDLSLPRARRLLSGGSDSAPSTNAPVYPSGPPSDANPPRRRRPEERQRSPSPGPVVGPLSPRERFQDAKEKFLLLERQRIEEQGRLVQKRREKERLGSPRGSSSQGGMPSPSPRNSSGSQRNPRAAPRETRHSRGREEWASEEEYDEDDLGDNYDEDPEDDEETERIRRVRARRPPPPPLHRLPSPPPDDDLEDPDVLEEEVFERVSGGYFGPRRAPEYRRSRESLLDTPPEDVVGHRGGSRGSGGRYVASGPPPTPNHHPASPPRHMNLPPHILQQQDKKRRSMFDVVEEERRRSSNELAKEFKRRSYHEPDIAEEGRRGGGRRSGGPPPPSGTAANYHELADHERYPGLDRETARLSHHHAKAHRTPSEGTAVGGGGGRYRHSYAEPEMFHHRGSGRMGMAAIHPY